MYLYLQSINQSFHFSLVLFLDPRPRHWSHHALQKTSAENSRFDEHKDAKYKAGLERCHGGINRRVSGTREKGICLFVVVVCLLFVVDIVDFICSFCLKFFKV